MSDGIFEPRRVAEIRLLGLGTVKLWKPNIQKVMCVHCTNDILQGEGYRFVAEDRSGKRTGYICGRGVAQMLSWGRFRWNPFTEELWANAIGAWPGEELVKAWEEGGPEGLFECLHDPTVAQTEVAE